MALEYRGYRDFRHSGHVLGETLFDTIDRRLLVFINILCTVCRIFRLRISTEMYSRYVSMFCGIFPIIQIHRKGFQLRINY